MPSALSKLVCSCQKLGHPWTPSCSQAFLDIYKHSWRESLKIYASFYAVTHWLRQKDRASFIKLPLDVIRSSAFLSANAGLYVFFYCLLRKILGGFFLFSVGFLPGLPATFISVLLEKKYRRGLLALYTCGLALQSIGQMLTYRGLIPHPKLFFTFLFCSASSLSLFRFSKGHFRRETIDSIFSHFFPNLKKNVETRALHPKAHDVIDRTSKQQFARCLKSFIFRFMEGFVLQSVFKTIAAVPLILSSPKSILGILGKALFNRSNFDFGCFLGAFTSLFHGTSSFLYLLCPSLKDGNTISAGFVSGLSIWFYHSPTLLSFLILKTVLGILEDWVASGSLPNIPHFDALCYSLSTSFVFHVGVVEPHNLPLGYWKLLDRLTAGGFSLYDRQEMEIWGTDAMRMFL